MKILTKKLYEHLLKYSIEHENYEAATKIRDVLPTIKDDETVEVEDATINTNTDERPKFQNKKTRS